MSLVNSLGLNSSSLTLGSSSQIWRKTSPFVFFFSCGGSRFSLITMLKNLLPLVLQYWHVIVLFFLVIRIARNYFNRGLHRYPGPLLASLTDWWRFFDVLGRRPDITHLRLHKQHGDIVRLGPNTLSFANPQALKAIYGPSKGFVKVGI